MSVFIDGLSWALLVLGGFICVTGAIGMHRFPDFFSRMHATSVTDTLGGSLVLIGLMLQFDGQYLVLIKLILILLFILFTGPTGSHALAKAALHGGLRPKLGPDQDQQQEADVLAHFEQSSVVASFHGVSPNESLSEPPNEPSSESLNESEQSKGAES